MKKVLCFIMTAVLAASSLAGCSSQGSSAPPAEGAAGQPEGGSDSSSGGSSGGGAKAAAGGTTADGKYDLVFWVYSDAVLNDQKKLFGQWVKEYCEENKNVNSITLIGKNDSDLLTSLMAGVGLPDMFFASAKNLVQYKDAIDLLDLSPVYADAEYKDGFYDSAINAVSVDNGMWAIPFMSYVPIIFRNTDVMEKAGVDWKNEDLTTWDVFYDECEKVKAAGIDATHSWAQGGFFCPGAVLACDAPKLTVGLENGETTLKPDQLVRTFDTLKKLETYSNGMSYSDEAASEAFKSNELAFICAGPYNEPDYIQAGTKYDVQLIPPYEENGWTGGLQGWDFMYGVNTGDEGRNEAIRGWLKKMGSFEVQQEFAKVIGRSVLREDVMEDPDTQQTKILAILQKGLKCGMNQMDFGHSSVFWTSAIGDVAPEVANGSVTPEDGAVRFIDGINGLYAEAGEE